MINIGRVTILLCPDDYWFYDRWYSVDNSGMYNYCRLKDEIKNELLGAYFGGGYGAVLVEISDLDRMTEAELVEMAKRLGIDILKYIQN